MFAVFSGAGHPLIEKTLKVRILQKMSHFFGQHSGLEGNWYTGNVASVTKLTGINAKSALGTLLWQAVCSVCARDEGSDECKLSLRILCMDGMLKRLCMIAMPRGHI